MKRAQGLNLIGLVNKLDLIMTSRSLRKNKSPHNAASPILASPPRIKNSAADAIPARIA